MKKTLYLMSAILTLNGLNTFAEGSTITISGYVRDNTCMVSTESKEFTVNLMLNAAKQFSSLGAATPKVPFSIVLSGCGDSVKAVKVGFSGIQDDDNSDLLKIDGGITAAAGMAVEILDSQQNKLPINAAAPSLFWYPLTTGQTNTLNFYARLVATHIPVTAGKVFATATFTLEFQ